MLERPTLAFDQAHANANTAMLAVHDLRGAVHAMLGFLSVLLSQQPGPLTATQQDFVSSAFLTSRRIERLVNDLQTIAFDGQLLTLVPDDCDLRAAVEVCIRELEMAASGFDVAVELQLDSDGPWRIVADPIRIEQIAFNVIENAIRYSAPNSTVVVRLRASRSRLMLVVKNEVSDPQQADPERWFGMFQRGNQSARNGGRRGLGIGLTVVQTLTAAHGGTICSRVRDQTVSIAVSLPKAALAGRTASRSN